MGYFKEKLSVRFFLFIGFSYIFVQVPFLGDYMKIVNTLIHETGHALIAIFGGNVETISLFMDSSGVTHGTKSIWIIDFVTSLAGYVFSSLMAYISFWLISKKKYTLLIDILLGFILLNLIFWVRNPYGLFWLVSFGLMFLVLLIKGSKSVVNNLLLFIASILLIESISTAYEILVISFMQPHSAGDTTNLAQLTLLMPAPFWGVFFFLQALLFCLLSFKKGFFKLQ